MKGYYTIEVRDKEGKLLSRERRKSRSYVQQWNELVCVQVGQKAALSMKDTGGTDRDITTNGYNFAVTGGVGADSLGVVVGTGSTAVTIADYALAVKCDEGTGANQLNYLACTVSDPTVLAPSCSFTILRSALNNSGSTITVAEIGVYMLGRYGTTSYYFLAIRDVLTTTQTVPDGGAITVVYTLKVTV
uniref:Uncharacterized protein n=1 Tax=viral metagenome TaxID=1070528 RepID=A0A6M3Y0Z1_9ZZZZ